MKHIFIVTTKSVIKEAKDNNSFQFISLANSELAKLWCNIVDKEASEEFQYELANEGIDLTLSDNNDEVIVRIVSHFIKDRLEHKKRLYHKLTRITDSDIWIYGSLNYDNDRKYLPFGNYNEYLTALIRTVIELGNYIGSEFKIDLLLHNGDIHSWTNADSPSERKEDETIKKLPFSNLEHVYSFSHSSDFFEDYVNEKLLKLGKNEPLYRSDYFPPSVKTINYMELEEEIKEVFNKNKDIIGQIIYLKQFGSSIPMIIYEVLYASYHTVNSPVPSKPFFIFLDKEMSVNEKVKHSLLFNSTIWIHSIELTADKEINKNKLENAISRYRQFKQLGLYEEGSAQEYIDYQIRIGKENFLTGSHANIPPSLYGYSDQYVVNHGKYKNISMRILMVDDKIGQCCEPKDILSENNNYSITLKKCDHKIKDSNSISDEKNQPSERKCEECRLYKIRALMSSPHGQDEYAFSTQINALFTSDIIPYSEKIVDTQDQGKENLFFKKEVNPAIKILGDDKKSLSANKENIVEIIAVRDIRSAIMLLSEYKVDAIFIDYLLANKFPGNESIREYGIDFFKELKSDSPFISNVRQKRGPHNKFWIVPISAFSDTFFDHLKLENINTIDHYWHILSGSDPLNTPIKFLQQINDLLKIQLEAYTYEVEDLQSFFYNSYKGLKNIIKEEDSNNFGRFQSFMGGEYCDFMQKHGSRLLVLRDADQDSSSNSLFAKYVWESFYANNNPEKEKRLEKKERLELNYRMRHFYHVASTCVNDYDGLRRLREAIGDIDVVIKQSVFIKKELKSLSEAIIELKRIITSFNN